MAADEHDAQPTPMAEEARRLRASWLVPSSEASKPRRRIGWLAVGIAVGAVMLLAVRLAADTSDVDPGDPGWGDIAFFVSPFLAIAAAIVIGLVLVFVAALRLVGLTAGRAGRAVVIGLVGGPLIYLAVLIASAAAVDETHSSQVLAFMTLVFPVICGIGVTLAAALVQPRPTSV